MSVSKFQPSATWGSTPVVQWVTQVTDFILALGGLKGTKTATGTLDFGTVASATVSELTISVPGAKVGDPVGVAPPDGFPVNVVAVAFVSAADVVTIRVSNTTNSGIVVGSGSYRVVVFRYA